MSLVPPQNLEAEEAVLGAMLLSPLAVDVASEDLRPDHFYRGTHAAIFQACVTVAGRDMPVNAITVAEELDSAGELERVGGTARVSELAAMVSAASNVAHYTKIVRDHATRRSLIDVGQEIARLGREDARQDLDDALIDAEQLVWNLTSTQAPGELRHVAETLPHTFEQLDRPGGEITGTPTGLADLDKLTAGLQPGNLVVVAARPGMGKSALAIQSLLHTATENPKPAALFTLEMSAEEINQRLLSLLSRVPLMRIRTRNGLTPPDRTALGTARSMLEQAPVYVDDTVAARVVDIRARARRLKARQPDLALVVVDYLQLMIHDGTGRENREQQVAAISRGLKLLARELDVPVMALAQLNRLVEQRHDKKPILSDLRDSGAIEQDADVVLFIHRDPDSEDDTAEITVAKHRNGPTGSTPVTWLRSRATFANHQPEPA